MSGATLLRGFMRRHGVTLRAAAVALGVSDPCVHDWRRGRKRPRGHYREAIEVWTGGEVPSDSWLRDDERAALAGVRPFSVD